MKSIFVFVSMSGVILLLFSCATVPNEPLAPGEVRLLRMDVPKEGDIRSGYLFTVNYNFEADGRPEMRRACFFWSGDGPYCSRVTKVTYGSPKTIQVDLIANMTGYYFLESYIQYVQDGKTRSTNVVSTHIYIIR
jgi:hypothetical protein